MTAVQSLCCLGARLAVLDAVKFGDRIQVAHQILDSMRTVICENQLEPVWTRENVLNSRQRVDISEVTEVLIGLACEI